MTNKTALKKYNKAENILVVSNFPEIVNEKFSNVSGVATYTYHMLDALISKLKLSEGAPIILAETLKNPSIKDSGDYLLIRSWRRSSLSVFYNLSKTLLEFSSVKKIFFHFEFNMYGNALITGLLPFYLHFLSWRGKNITLLAHQIVEDLGTLSGHINIKENSLKIRILNFLLRIYFRFLFSGVNKIVVHDEVLRERAKKHTKKPVFVVPHGQGEYPSTCTLEEARKNLQIPKSHFVVLCFGFLTWYKGSDWILDQFVRYFEETKDKKVRLILAGGRSANLKGQDPYDDYYDALLEKSRYYPNIEITGFIPDEDVKYYYCASDVVVLPYRTQMSASGPFAIGLSFDRPFLLSDNLQGVLETSDVKSMMNKHNISEEEILFKMNKRDFFEKISYLMSSKRIQNKLSRFSAELSGIRDWKNVVEKFMYIINA